MLYSAGCRRQCPRSQTARPIFGDGKPLPRNGKPALADIARIPERSAAHEIVMIMDTLLLVIVCFFYGFAHHLFPMNVAFVVCCLNYVLDSVISLASMASNVYVQDLSDSRDEVRATLSTGLSLNHLITILVALFGGWIWQTLGIETLFALSAVLGLCNSAYAATIKTRKAAT